MKGLGRMIATGAVVVATLITPTVVDAAVRDSLDFGWRFHLGDPVQQNLCPASAFEDFNNTFCEHWGHVNPHGALALEFCRLACCGDPACAGWTWNHNGNTCYMGSSTDRCVPAGNISGLGRGNVGGMRRTPAAPAMPPNNGPQSIGYDDSKWRGLNVPHDYVVEQLPDSSLEGNHGCRPKNVSWYRKNITITAAQGRGIVWLEFDGVYRSADFFLNGQYLGHHSSGYTSFRFRLDDLSYAIIDGSKDNILAVRVDPRADEGWFYEGGGIYRHVYLTSAQTVHVAPNGVYVPSIVDPITIKRSASAPATGNANITIQTELEGFAEYACHGNRVYVVISTIVDRDGHVVWTGSSKASLPPPLPHENCTNNRVVVTQCAIIEDALLWEAPTHTPPSTSRVTTASASASAAMYTLETKVAWEAPGVVVDMVNTSFGIRRFDFDPQQGLLLNGNPVKAKGMCNHQDFAAVGTAVPDRLQTFRVNAMKAYGVNAWRMSHNPPNPELLETLDTAGFLVMNENRNFGNHTTWIDDFADFIKRDRNHPSIVWWSVCNEVGCRQATGDATLAIGKGFKQVLQELDPVATRPMTGAWKNWPGNGTVDRLWAEHVVDVYGVNYFSPSGYDSFHNSSPAVPMVASEHCSCQSDRTPFANSTMGLKGAYSAWPCIKDCWEPVANRSFVQGLFDWTGFDYRGENHWPDTNSEFGMLDLAGFPKSSAWYYKSQFLPDTPVVRIAPDSWEDDAPAPASNPKVGVVVAQCESTGRLGLTQGFDLVTSATPMPLPQPLLSPSSSLSVSLAGNTMVRSKFDKRMCLGYESAGYQAMFVQCIPGNQYQLFNWNVSTGVLKWTNATMTRYLDLHGGTGPEVGFFGGFRASNQEWLYDAASNKIQSKASTAPGQCITFEGSAGQRQVWVYTNGDAVQLYLNGKPVGGGDAVPQQVDPFDKASWLLPYSSGNLTAVATKNGKYWGRNTVETSGAATTLALTIDAPTATSVTAPPAVSATSSSNNMNAVIFADGQDICILSVAVHDARGRIVRLGSLPVTVTIAGPGLLLGFGNGNPADHTQEGRGVIGSTVRSTFNGLLRILIQSKRGVPGDIVVTAHSVDGGVASASVTVTAQ